MGYVVRMPQLGMTMEEGAVVEWGAAADEPFEEGEVIAVVESEKTTNEIEAREDGQFLSFFVDVNETVEPGDPIAYVGDEDETVPENVESEAQRGTDDESTEENVAATGGVPDSAESTVSTRATRSAKVSPRARSYAREQNIDVSALGNLAGSGPDDAVIERDVVEATGSDLAPTSTPAAEPGEGRQIVEERDQSGLRRTIADRMTESALAPQVTLNRSVRIDAMMDIRERLAADRDLDLSITDFVVAAVVEALGEYPEFNAIYEDSVHKLAAQINVGIAVDIDAGLVTPVLRGAGQRSISEIRSERQRLVSLVKSGEHTMDDLADGTFTITNLGHFGVESFDPILNPPQVGTLGVNSLQQQYDPESGEKYPELGLSLTFDHRAVDGADAARFLGAIADALQHPLRLVTLGRGPTPTDKQSTSFDSTEEGPEDERVVATHSNGDIDTVIRSRGFEWRADEPEDLGGADDAPNPVEQFLGSLGSCLSVMIALIAERREVPVDDVDIVTSAEPETGRIEAIHVDVTIRSDADASDVERVVQSAKQGCYVDQVVTEDVERTLDLTIEPT